MLAELPSEIIIRKSIRPGTVYYCKDDRLSSPEPHYFIVINHNPAKDQIILLLCASSQVQNVKNLRRSQPADTVVEIKPGDYPDFNKYTIIDCNVVFDTEINKIIEKYRLRELVIKEDLDQGIVELLRDGVLISRLITGKIKKLIRD